MKKIMFETAKKKLKKTIGEEWRNFRLDFNAIIDRYFQEMKSNPLCKRGAKEMYDLICKEIDNADARSFVSVAKYIKGNENIIITPELTEKGWALYYKNGHF